MATSHSAPLAKATPSIGHLATDPLRNFKFNVNIMHPNITGFATLGFMTVSGLNITTEVIPYREGGMNAQSLDSLVLTSTGWKRMGDIQVGDQVIDPFGQDSYVLGVYPKGIRDIYAVTLADGSTAEACYQHLWSVEVRNGNSIKTVVVDTLALKALVDTPSNRVLVPRVTPVRYSAVTDLPIDPYVLGVLLAEGSIEDEGVSFASKDQEVIDRVANWLPSGHFIKTYYGVKHRISTGNLGRSGGSDTNTSKGRNAVLQACRDLGLVGCRSWEKFIPEVYMRASVEERIELLRGYLDGDGSISTKGCIRYTTTSPQLSLDLQELIRSLGGRCTIKHRTGRTYMYQGKVTPARDIYETPAVAGLDFNPFYLTRKATRFSVQPKGDATMRKVISVEFAGEAEVQCIEVSADSHLYLTNHLIPTHNTTTQKMPGQSDFAPITLSQGVAVGSGPMWQWMKELFTVMQGTGNGTPGKDFRATVDIMVLDHPVTSSTVPVKAIYRVYNAWPTSIAFSDLDAGANAVLMQQLSLAHEGFDMKLATKTGLSGVSF